MGVEIPIGAHPRLRGEHYRPATIPSTCWGSSPLTRGAPDRDIGQRVKCRLIPAYAGSTPPRELIRTRTGAHPRLRGEHASSRAAIASAEGSSPLTRGARDVATRQRGKRGLIPAYAGSTQLIRNDLMAVGAHPRLRGEHHFARFYCAFRAGSSPLTRGARRRSIR